LGGAMRWESGSGEPAHGSSDGLALQCRPRGRGAGLVGWAHARGTTLSHAASPQSPPQSSSQPPSPSMVSKINRDLPGARTGMLFLVKDNTAHINGLNYPLAPGVLIETVPPGVVIQTHKGPLLPVSE